MYKFDANEQVGVFLARCSVQHLVISLNLHLFIRLCLLAYFKYLVDLKSSVEFVFLCML